MKTLFTFLTLSLSLLALPAQAAEQCDIDVQVNGLVCDFCAQALEKVFLQREEVSGIEVNLDTGIVAVHIKPGQQPLDDTTLTQLITDSGYNVTDINKEACPA